MKPEFLIANKKIGLKHPVYFIADIAANHDGNLERAKELIRLAQKSGADAAKFQNFSAPKIVSDFGFKHLGQQQSHQAKWKKSVFEVYEDASISFDWTAELKKTCDEVGIHYFSSPYDFAAVDHLDPYVPAYKIGSGDITWPEIMQAMAKKNKPMILSTGASTLAEVKIAVDSIASINDELVLLQCNTNYTASPDNYRYINLNVLRTYRDLYPDIILGLSDHTKTLSTVLGAIVLGARVIEKHFTDDDTREGPDHPFSLTPHEWQEMVDRSQELCFALGDGVKRVEENEKETVILQRRALRVKTNLKQGHIIQASDLEALRPCPEIAFRPYEIDKIIGKTLKKDLLSGQEISPEDI